MRRFLTVLVLAVVASVACATSPPASTPCPTNPPSKPECRTFSYVKAAVNVRSSAYYSSKSGFSLQYRDGRQALYFVLDLLKDLPCAGTTLELTVEKLAAQQCSTSCWTQVLQIPKVLLCSTNLPQILDYINILGIANSTPVIKPPYNKGLYTLVKFVPSTLGVNLIAGHTKVTYSLCVNGKAIIDFELEIVIDDSKCKK